MKDPEEDPPGALPGDWSEDWPRPEQLFRLAMAVCHDSRIAEDIAAEAALKAVIKWKDETMEQRTKWSFGRFRTIIRNLVIDHRRKEASENTAVVDPSDFELQIAPARTVPEQAERRELLATIHDAIDELPTSIRDVLRHRFVLGHSVAATVEALGLSQRTVERRFTEGLVSLRRTLGASTVGALPFSTVLHRSARVVPAREVAAAGGVVGLGGTLMITAALVGLLLVALGVAHAVRAPATSAADLANVGRSVASPADERRDEETVPLVSVEPGGERKGRTLDPATEGAGPNPTEGATQDPPATTAPDADRELIPFTIQIRVDGEPAPGWTATQAEHDPDRYDLDPGIGPRSEDGATTDDSGVATFQIPEIPGPWLFVFVSPDNFRASVWVHVDPAAESSPFVVEFDARRHVVKGAGARYADLDWQFVQLVANPRPGVWVACMPEDPKGSADLEFSIVAVGPQRLCSLTRRYVPDAWEELVVDEPIVVKPR